MPWKMADLKIAGAYSVWIFSHRPLSNDRGWSWGPNRWGWCLTFRLCWSNSFSISSWARRQFGGTLKAFSGESQRTILEFRTDWILNAKKSFENNILENFSKTIFVNMGHFGENQASNHMDEGFTERQILGIYPNVNSTKIILSRDVAKCMKINKEARRRLIKL